jgi:hypothetical protein
MMAAESKAKATNLSQQFGGAQLLLGSDSLLNDGQQFALQRSMMPLRALAQAVDHVIRGVLDRKIDGHGVPNLLRFGT